MDTKTLPNFLVIGVQRSGTTWLHLCLKSHPEIFMPFVKELTFFSQYYDKGLDWYQRYFSTRSKEKAVGEVSPDYIYRHDGIAAKRIAKDLPGVKLIVIFRNPIDRAFSQYKKHWFHGALKDDFETALKKNPEYIERAKYATQLKRYLALWPKEKILTLIYEDIKEDPHAFLKRIYTFLEVDINFVSPHTTSNIPPESLEKGAHDHVARVSLFLRQKMHFGKLIDALKQTHVRLLMDRIFLKFDVRVNPTKRQAKELPTAVKPETRSRLSGIFKQEREELSLLLNRDLSFWK